MIVPITSDLAGYAAFWTRIVVAVAIPLIVSLVGIFLMLVLIYRKL